jgi:hypothetical protein
MPTPDDPDHTHKIMYDCVQEWRRIGTVAGVFAKDNGEAEANARLMAAAPELLAALREIAEGCARRLRKGKDQGDLDTLRVCRRAIAAAEGRSDG